MLIKKVRKKTAEPFVFLHGKKTAAYGKIPDTGRKIMDSLNRFIGKRKAAITGPVVWSYESAPKARLTLRAGIQVKKGTRGKAPFSAKTEAEWECLSAEYTGSMEHITEAWSELFAVAEKKGLGCENARREIYRKWIAFYSKDNLTELQIKLSGDGKKRG